MATPALVLGIVACSTLILCGWAITGVPSLILGTLAIIFGALAKNEIQEHPGLGGWGQAQAGFVIGIVTVALCVLFVLLLIMLIGGVSLSAA